MCNNYRVINAEECVKYSKQFPLKSCKRGINPYPATWAIWRAPTNANKWRMGFNPYPANVDNMASSYQC